MQSLGLCSLSVHDADRARWGNQFIQELLLQLLNAAMQYLYVALGVRLVVQTAQLKSFSASYTQAWVDENNF